MYDLKALQIFLLAAKHLNFAEVAREMAITPSSVTRTIAALEQDLGVQLFLRTTRQVALTSDGANVAARIAPSIKELQNIRQELLSANKADQGLLRLNAPMSLGQKVLAPIISGFREQFPRIDVQVRLTDNLIDMVDENCDLAIRISGPPSDKFTIWRKLCVVRRVLVAAPGSSWAKLTELDDIRPEECMAFSGDSQTESWHLDNGNRSVTIIAGQSVSANNGEVLAGLAADGVGVALLPVFVVSQMVRSGRLVCILPEWEPPELWLTLYYPPYQSFPPRVAAFSNYFEETITPLVNAIE